MTNTNPFRPGSGISPPYFAGRNREIDIFRKKLDKSMNDDFIQHMAIVSGWGSGKTSLLLKFKEIARGINCPVLPVQLYSVMDTKDFVELFVNSASFVVPPSKWKKFSSAVSSLGINVMGTGVQVVKQASFFEPQTAFCHSLKNIWNNSHTQLIPVMIDDIQLITKKEQTLEILRNVFTWAANEGYKFMLVVSGTLDLFERFQEAHSPLTRFFEPLILNPLSSDEIRDAVLKPLENTSISFSDDVVEQIITLSEGNPSYIQLLASHAFEHARNNIVNLDDFKLSLISAINDVSARMFDNMFNKLCMNEKNVLRILYESEVPMRWGEVLEMAENSGIKRASARTSLKRLIDNELLKSVKPQKYEKQYTLRDVLFKEYLSAKLDKVSKVSKV
ncbi:MAG: hypothetical protein CVT89_03380 [Candidatus Altiarchaeales archaeon HGW-Altiarchaeales-2]|nr:MAG: hypothetical protein CVT89_03380 [Candidatus Altiarchaeales archaeon HGW-Altiarchaeales-2]